MVELEAAVGAGCAVVVELSWVVVLVVFASVGAGVVPAAV